MMRRKTNETLNYTPNMLQLARALRKRDDGRGYKRCGTTRTKERRQPGSGIKDRDERSRGTEILMADASPKSNEQNPFGRAF